MEDSKNSILSFPTSYRPIALLSFIAKTLEKIILFEIIHYITFLSHQYGFRHQHSITKGAGCALQQECRRSYKPRQLPTTKHFENSSIIYYCSPKVTNNLKQQVSLGTHSKKCWKSIWKLALNNNNNSTTLNK